MQSDTTQLTGKVYDIQPFSVQDGPGIRTTVFLKGCPLRCPWCHSPESQLFPAQLSWIQMKCVGCGACAELCPIGAITYDAPVETSPGKIIRPLIIDRDKCTNCGACTAHCHPKALFLCGTDYTVEQVMEKVIGDIPFYKRSGGGVTISGGEPLCQPKFVFALLKALKAADIQTAVDTTGFVSGDVIREVLPYTDLFLYDLKHMDSVRHKEVVGVPNEQIHTNARLICSLGGKMQVRIPLITGINDSDENMHATGRFCAEICDAVTSVQLLPFHNLGDAKYPRIGRTDIFSVPKPTDERIEECKSILESYGLTVTVH